MFSLCLSADTERAQPGLGTNSHYVHFKDGGRVWAILKLTRYMSVSSLVYILSYYHIKVRINILFLFLNGMV